MKEVTLTVSLEKKEDRILITYEVNNASKETIYLENVVLGRGADGRLVPNANAAIVAIEEGVVLVKKGWAEMPEGIYRNPLPVFVTILESQRTFKETFELSLPLMASSPYDLKERSYQGSALAKEFSFSLDYGQSSRYSNAEEKEYNGVKVTKIVSQRNQPPDYDWPKGGTLTSPKFKIEIPFRN